MFGESAAFAPLRLRRGDEKERLAMAEAEICVAGPAAEAVGEERVVERREGQSAGDAQGELAEAQGQVARAGIGEGSALLIEDAVDVADFHDDADGAGAAVKTAAFGDTDGLIRR